MKSFPSTANEARNMYGGGNARSYEQTFDIERLTHGSLNLNKSVPVIQEMLKENNINASNYQAYTNMMAVPRPHEYITPGDDDHSTNIDTSYSSPVFGNINLSNGGNLNLSKNKGERIYYENPLQLPAEVIALAKDYDWIYKYRVKELASVGEKSGSSLLVDVTNTAISPSMFNPMYGVNCLGIIRNTPLLNDIEDVNINEKISDCSIRMLCALSKQTNSELGMARYKYADFMYCKDLGKVPNNHLITLRKFAHPVSDHIFEMSSPKYISSGFSFETEGDVGRLVTWFGTDENKLEDIIKYSYHASWVEKNADIQQEETNADDQSTGIIGMISNSLNPVYNRGVEAGQVGTHSIWGWLGSKLSKHSFQGIGKNNGLLRNYDNNKVYTPKNTVQSTHLYEGKLEFSHEFTINFSYQLRAYDNINPRSAFLDLIGNILEVTYRRGKFWGGSRKIIGPAQNTSAFRKVNDFIDNGWDRLGGLFTSLMNGGINMQEILGTLGAAWPGAISRVMNGVKQAADGHMAEAISNLVGWIQKLNTTTGFSEAAKGYLKNALGRPTMYAWNSILDGSPTGLWHVTIGNPRNPIMAIGNLILVNSQITQMGPLGIDDFPSELRVSITLKHATPRDVTDIGRMYTKGANAIYHVMAHHNINDFWGSSPATPSSIENFQNQNKKQSGDAASLQGSYSRNSDFQKEVNKAAKNPAYFNSAPIGDDQLPNPFLENDEHVLLARKNNYSDHMLYASIQEVA